MVDTPVLVAWKLVSRDKWVVKFHWPIFLPINLLRENTSNPLVSIRASV